jgi:hypothetical protein
MSSAADFHALSEELRLDAQNPWPGLTAFTEKQHKFFYGREQESHELFSCVKRDRLTVLFGKSGLGKTSLLQAGLFPQLRAADYLPVYVRLSYEDHAAPFDTQLRTALESAIELANFAEVALPQAGESVWEYLHRRGGNLINDDGNVVMPVLIFDQFEECFTLGARKEFSSRLCNEFLPGLAEMIENRTPAALTRKLTDDRDLAKRYDLEAPGCRILITLREDYLANLEALRDSMPSLVYIDNRMRLTEMTGEQALSVVVDPSPDLVAADVAESIVRFVAGAHTDSAEGNVRTVDVLPLKQLEVAPAILSLFCSQLNEERLKTPGMAKITRALVLSQGVTIIEDFYKKCIADMHPAVRRLIEDRLLTSAGYRDNIDLAEARASLERAGAKPSCIDDLVRLRLLQIEDHRGVPRLELTHDVLAEPVKHSRDEWKKEQQHEAAQQQEREALLRAKEAEQEALKRTHFLQRMVAAAAFVCLLLAGVVVWGAIERSHARKNADSAAQSQKAAEQSKQMALDRAEQAIQANARAVEEAHEASLNEAKAEDSAKQAQQSTLRAQASAKEALDSKDQALGMQKKITGLSGDVLHHCITIYNAFDDAAGKEKDNDGKDQVRLLYEHFLMDPSQCLDLAKEAHQAEPQDVDVTDSLTMIPVRAAASAADRHASAEAIRKQILDDLNIALNLPLFKDESNKDVTQIELARVYLAFAYLLSYIHDDSAQSIADKGLKIIANLRTQQAKLSAWDYYDWDILGEADNWYALYLQNAGKSADAIGPLIAAFNEEKRAADLAPKEKPYYAGETLYRAQRVADSEKDLNTKDDAAIQWYQQTLALAKQQDNKAKVTEIYTDLKVVLVRDKKYDDALALLSPRIQSLMDSGEGTQRDKDLAQAYRDFATVEEARDHWAQAVVYREHVADLLRGMRPDAYADQRSDLVYAYSLVSWAEIFAGDVGKGVDDAQKAISLSNQTDGNPGLADSYDNVVKALSLNKHYDDAQKMVQQHIQWFLSGPKSIEKARDLAYAYRAAAEIEETRKQWAQGIVYRKDVLQVLAALKPEDYDDQRSDVLFAYSLLSWDEIFAGQTDAGIADTQKSIQLSTQTEAHTGLYTVYENGINALTQNERYDQAESLLDAFTQTLSAAPAGTLRERELATVVDADRAAIAEATKHYSQAVPYRIDAVKRLSALDPDAYDSVKADLVSAYGNLSFGQEEAGNFVQGVEAAKAGLNLDPSQAWIEENEGSGLLMSGHPDEARTVYMKIKDIQWRNAPLSNAISDDLTLFCKLGYTPPETAGIAHDLGITSPELFSCLATAAQAGKSK